MRYTPLIAIVLLAGCGGSPGPSGDWIVGSWQMHICENIATGERVAAEDLGVSGGFVFSARRRWEGWREGWPEGRVEGRGEWEFLPPDIYKLTSGDWTGAIQRVGDEWYSVGMFGPDAYKFWHRRLDKGDG